jgi:hypothetical protein
MGMEISRNWAAYRESRAAGRKHGWKLNEGDYDDGLSFAKAIFSSTP